MRQIIRALVTDLAEDVYECSDGAQAVAAYATQQPEWVLMDIEMPILDGLTATRQIKQAFPAAHIVIVSNYGDERMRAAAVQAGASHFVLKENLLQLRGILSAPNPEQTV
ncbi:MAG: response regulator transcription factor [Acidobacteriaceae bacterium]|nr:response regulator transcription factor [Acidobacteriaceae bacterium]